MPVVQGLDELRPGGAPPYAEHTAGTQIITGTYDQSSTICSTYQLQGGTYHCVVRSTYRRYKATTRASFRLAAAVQPVTTRIRVSRDGLAILDPSYLVARLMTPRFALFSDWITAEPTLPLPPTAP